MSILSSPVQSVLNTPLSSPLFSGSMWWLAFDQNANLAYDLSNGRYMRGGGFSTLALSLTETRASSAMVLQSNGTYVERAAGELAIGQGVGLQVSGGTTVDLVTSDILADAYTSGATVTAAGYTEAGLFEAATITGTGATWNRAILNVDTVTLNSGQTYFGTFFYQEGTSPNAVAILKIASVDTQLAGPVGNLSVVFSAAGAAVITKQTTMEGNNGTIYVCEFEWTPNATTASANVGVGPYSTTSGHTLVGLGVYLLDDYMPYTLLPSQEGIVAADNPVVAQGLGDELLADGVTPHTWLSSGATLTDNPDGSTAVASTGETWNRTYPLAIPWSSGVKHRGQQKYAVGSSTVAKLTIRDSTNAVESHISGLIGALAVTHEGAGSLELIGQSVEGGVHTVDYYFTPNSTTPNLGYVGFGPNTATVGEDVIVISCSLAKVLAWPAYNPDSQAYAETLTQFMPNPSFGGGTVGYATIPEYGVFGINSGATILAPEIVGGVVCNPISIRRVAAGGYEGLRALNGGGDHPIPVGSHLISYYIRRPTGVAAGTLFAYVPGGSPNTLWLNQIAEIEAFPADTWVRQLVPITVAASGSQFGFMSNGPSIGAGYDIALFNVILNTTQDVETQSEQGAFSRILAGDGFASTVFPSAKDLVPGRFDSQADVDLWGPSSTDPEQMTRTEVDGRMEMVRGSGGVEGRAARAELFKGGAAYAFEVAAEGRAAINSEFTGLFLVDSQQKTTYGIAPVGGNREISMWNWDTDTTVQIDSLSVQEVEPGVVVEAVGVWGSSEGLHVLRLDDPNDGGTFILVQRASGKIKLKVKSAGTTLFDQNSTIDWPDDAEGTFRLELTDTDGGCFAAVFLDDVFVIGSDAFDYSHAINQLILSPVVGVKTIKQVYGK